MNILFVNYVHPGTAHVSSMRSRLFAAGLADLGHRVVLLTHSIPSEDAEFTPHRVEAALAAHDWSRPFHLTCSSQPDWRTAAAHSAALLRPARQAIITLEFMTRGSLWEDWVRGSRPYWQPLAAAFRPDIVFAICGDTGSLALAQGFARYAQVPWIMDHKDNWERCIPRPMRSVLARRYADAAGFTSNAHFHAEIAARYHRQPHTIVYSGVVPEMVAADDSGLDLQTFRITLIGSIRDENLLRRYLAGLARWLAALSPEDRAIVELVYAGPAHAMVAAAVREIAPPCRSRVEAYLALADLGKLCRSAAVNTYLWAPTTFHHKLLELLACRRPAISFPGEHAESIGLARQVGGDLRPCGDAAALGDALGAVWQDWRDGSPGDASRAIDGAALTWDAMARKLESFLIERHAAAMASRSTRA